ncbi:YMGG-like glycine zipper-containing protein [Desulfoferrobacter suflitae]|uniref:YMGG-like glycine zipper-containing protein n=1 Tax=Desulfoferrobacter suflitae TaxID=2865782 RepID=UPI0021648E90|nr:YMGG-like glycine zipper-containing protein [Desulfoferrobacter suflitae]MCK8602173.1 glycine zipper domain-containing protein [Desulfoferrobacter suflitae]
MKKERGAHGFVVLGFLMLFLVAGCAGMNHTERHVLTGAAIGAGTGAVVGEVAGGMPGTGALLGGAAGALGGYIYDQSYRGDGRYYHNGYRYDNRNYGNRYRGKYDRYQYQRPYRY